MSLKQELISAGLSDKEAACYLTLLRCGTRSTSFVAKKAALNRGTAYVALHSLLAKGLVAKSTKQKVQYFTAMEPQQLLKYLENRKHALNGCQDRLQGMMGQFEALSNTLATMPKVEFFEGREGARIAFEDTLSSSDKTLRAFLSIDDAAEFLGAEYFEEYTDRRVESGYTLHAIRTLEKDKIAIKKNVYARRYLTNRKENRIVRYVSEELAFPITTYMYDDKLMILSSQAENFAMLIESRELCQMQKKLFSLLWESVAQEKS